MAMDFFENQERARRKTGFLVFLFILAVLAIMALVCLLIAIPLSLDESGGSRSPWLFVGVGGGVLLVVGGASLVRLSQLSGGGRVVAEGLGGSIVDPGSTDHHQRRVLNVVEEMAIAAGIPVPSVYIMEEEQAINAFAAGNSPENAVIGVTRGCIEQLTREELQGVIAHEFSHILNGDMRMNIRLMGIIFGIVVIGYIGQVLMRVAIYSPRSRARGSKDSGGLYLLAIGLGLLVIGGIGVFFGSWIRAAVSRQREFLADASAVQFTRNPNGIGNALRKIGGMGSRVQNPKASEISHLFFSSGISGFFASIFATHPPVSQRLQAIFPGWKEDDDAPFSGTPVISGDERVSGFSTGAEAGVPSTGVFHEQHLQLAAVLLDSIPSPIQSAAREPWGARGVIFALLLDDDRAVSDRQRACINEGHSPAMVELVQRVHDCLPARRRGTRLAILDLCMPALRELSAAQYRQFRDTATTLVRMDDAVSFFEACLGRLVLRRLDQLFDPASASVSATRPVRISSEMREILSALAHASGGDSETVRTSHAAGMAVLDMSGSLDDREACLSVARIEHNLDAVAGLRGADGRTFLLACVASVQSDDHCTEGEYELLRVVADALGCPMPLHVLK